MNTRFIDPYPLVLILKNGPKTKEQLAKDLKMHPGSVQRRLAILKKHNLIKIVSWKIPGIGGRVPIWGLNN